ncbi:Kinesin-like protein KIN-1 isoform B [Glycine soja]|uniref:Kinesin-like protein n=1 Tax=Glycine soja TaxID=3848 RepID=A0A445JFS0_GLYSO|nr:Kinesin-like protein KIN-1 isoform B [Glycine soja]
MSSITVCARFRPSNSKEKQNGNDSGCIRNIDTETFICKDEKDEEFVFSFDRVFYEKSEQADVYQFLALPIVRDVVVDAFNGTVITYGQTGAGKTYSMEGPGILECEEQNKGLLPRVVEGLFDSINSLDKEKTYSIKLSMVEIYMEKVRDLFDLSKDNIQIKEIKSRGIILPGVTEVSCILSQCNPIILFHSEVTLLFTIRHMVLCTIFTHDPSEKSNPLLDADLKNFKEITVLDPAEALQSLSRGIANRAVGETQMNVASSRSHCIYIFTIQQEFFSRDKRTRSGKLILVDLAGSEKVEKTGAGGRVLEEAKTINKSLSALGNVINSLTCGLQGKASHIPYRDSKLTRILQDALGGNARTALLCCCSPSAFNASESLSTLRFGARAKHIKESPRINYSEEKCDTSSSAASPSPSGDESSARILNKLREKLNVEDVKLLEELLIQEGILFEPPSVEEESDIEDLTLQIISSLQTSVEKLTATVDELKRENSILRAKVDASTESVFNKGADNSSIFQYMISGIPTFFFRWLGYTSPRGWQ